MKCLRLLSLLIFAASCFATDLSGNWAVRDPLPDGTYRTTYLNLKQNGSRITGTIRVTQFFYKIVHSSGGPATFTLTGSMMDGHTERRATYQVGLDRYALPVATHRRPDNQLFKMHAHTAHPRQRSFTAANTSVGYKGSYGHEEQDARPY